jgi:Type I restriction modification DNA specificity domain
MSPQFIQLQELGQIFQGITPSRYADEQGHSYSVINVTSLEDLYVKEPHTQTQLSIPDSQWTQLQLRENDVVIAIRGSLLKSSVVTKALEGSISNQNTVFFRANSKEIDPLYLAVLLRSDYVAQLPALRERQSTTTLPAMRVADLRSLKIPVPNLPTQHEIAQLFLAVEQTQKVTMSALETRQNLANVALLKALGG